MLFKTAESFDCCEKCDCEQSQNGEELVWSLGKTVQPVNVCCAENEQRHSEWQGALRGAVCGAAREENAAFAFVCFVEHLDGLI